MFAWSLLVGLGGHFLGARLSADAIPERLSNQLGAVGVLLLDYRVQ